MLSYAPGRVNLIGDHTDHTGGLVFPMAIDRGTRISFERAGTEVRLASQALRSEVSFGVDIDDPTTVEPAWGRYVAGVVAVVQPTVGIEGTITTDLPMESGLSSSAALEVATALALGFSGTTTELALACQRAETLAVGVPCGVMDQLASAAGARDHALLIDCSTLAVTPVRVPASCAIWVVDSGEPRALASSAYATRHAECESAERIIGPLREATVSGLGVIADPMLRRRARHVVTENARVREMAHAFEAADLEGAGSAMLASHASLRDDFEVSTAALDALVDELATRPGVYGARVTGAGFGGSVVVLTDAHIDLGVGTRVRASAGARVET
jgi:galactokinase